MMAGEQERLAASRVLVAGDVMLDRYWHGDVERISPEAPVPVVRMTTEECRLGGAANVANNVASLGAGVTLMGIVGQDEGANEVRRLLDSSGIENGLLHGEGAPTTVKLRINGRAQQLLRIDFEREPEGRLVKKMQQAFRDRCHEFGAVILSDYGKGGLALIRDEIAHARKIGVSVLVDPKGSDWTPYEGATVLTPNRAELKQVVGSWSSESDLATRVNHLRRKLGVEAILVTRSEEGMTLFDEDGSMHASAMAREVFDVTGAGDTVIATLGALVGSGLSLREAVPYANRAGGIVVGKFGAATVELEELFG